MKELLKLCLLQEDLLIPDKGVKQLSKQTQGPVVPPHWLLQATVCPQQTVTFGFVVDSHLQHQDLLLRFLQLLLSCVQGAIQAALRSRQAHAALLSLQLLPLNLAKDITHAAIVANKTRSFHVSAAKLLSGETFVPVTYS